MYHCPVDYLVAFGCSLLVICSETAAGRVRVLACTPVHSFLLPTYSGRAGSRASLYANSSMKWGASSFLLNREGWERTDNVLKALRLLWGLDLNSDLSGSGVHSLSPCTLL